MTDSDRDKAADTPAEGPSGAVAAPAGLEKAEIPTAQGETEMPAPAGDGPAAPGEAETPASKAKAPKKKSHWLDDLKAILWLILAVLTFHSCVAKPFYIPSESMMPGLLKGDRLVVSKYPYGWSWVSPSFHIFPHWQGRIWGEMPRRGDIVIVTPPGESSDYIKRVIGLPGDTIELVDGRVFLNGRELVRESRPPTAIPVDANVPCTDRHGRPTEYYVNRPGGPICQMPVFREYLPDGRHYDIIDFGPGRPGDDRARITVPEGRVFLMGDNRDESADSRFPAGGDDKGLGGPVPWENIGGRAEFITFSLDGSSSYWNPVSWFTALRGGRAGSSLHPASGPPRQGAPRP